MELNKIYNMDCLEAMKALPDKSIDLIITDPPYGIKAARYKRANTQYGKSLAKCRDYGQSDWDDKIPSKEIFDEMFRVSRNQIVFGGNYFISYLYNSPCWLVWDKNTGNNGYADCELVWTSFKTAVRKFKWTWKGFIQEDMKNKEERVHPTQKPVPLMEWIINNYSKECQTILDPFLGSGSTAIACINTNRNFIGFELDKNYFDIANERIEKAKS